MKAGDRLLNPVDLSPRVICESVYSEAIGLPRPTPEGKAYQRYAYWTLRHDVDAALNHYRLMAAYGDMIGKNIAVSDLMSAHIQSCSENAEALRIINGWKEAVGPTRWERWQRRLEWREAKACAGTSDS